MDASDKVVFDFRREDMIPKFERFEQVCSCDWGV